MEPQNKHLICNGVRLHYLDWGNHDAPPLVLLHGINGQAHTWDALAGTVRSRFHVLALDMRGHGESQWAADGIYDGPALLADVSEFVIQLRLDRVTIVGESLGGIVAFAWASLNPASVAGLVVADIGPEISPEGLGEIRRSAQDRPADFTDFEEALRWSRGEQPVEAEEAIAYRLRHNLNESGDGRLAWKYDPLVDTVTSSGGPDGDALMWQLWSALKCPTLVLRGERSNLLTKESVEKMLATCPTATLRTIPDAGHAIMVDNQAAFISETRAFLLRP